MSDYYPRKPLGGEAYYDPRQDEYGPPLHRQRESHPPEQAAEDSQPGHPQDDPQAPRRHDDDATASPEQLRPTQLNRLAHHDDGKAFAEYERGGGPVPRHNGPPSRPADYGRRPFNEFGGPHLEDHDRWPPEDHGRRPPEDYRRWPPEHHLRRHLEDHGKRPPEDRPFDLRHDDRADIGPSHERRDGNGDDRSLGAGAIQLDGASGGSLNDRPFGHGATSTQGGAYPIEHYEDRKRREREESRLRIRRDHDDAVDFYDPRAGSRTSTGFPSSSSHAHALSPAASALDHARYPPALRRGGYRLPPRRPRRQPSSSSDSYTSDD